jgi:hypothetical protein
MLEAAPQYWFTRLVFEGALAAVYLIAFVNAGNQFVPLLGERGLLPVGHFTRIVPFRSAPSLFYVARRDTAFRSAAWLGVGLAALALSGLPQHWGTVWSATIGDVFASGGPVVHRVAGEAALGRSRHIAAAAHEPVSRRPTTMGPRDVLRVPLRRPRRAPQDRPLVGAA